MGQSYNQQIEFIVENDKLVLVDKYYTSGLFITYKKDFEKDFLVRKTKDNILQVNLTLGNETYTPTNLFSTNVADYDRPYAGWFFLKAELANVQDSKALFFGLEGGITGDEALSGKLQNFIHRGLNIDDGTTWTEQIEFKVLVNIKAKYLINKNINKYHAFNYVIESSLGTKDIFIENGLGYYFGRFNNLKSSSRIGIINKTKENEFFGFVNFGYKYVAHNTLIQGGLLHDDVLFTTQKESHILKIKAGAVLSLGRNTFKFIYNFNTNETPKSTNHSYGGISFSCDF